MKYLLLAFNASGENFTFCETFSLGNRGAIGFSPNLRQAALTVTTAFLPKQTRCPICGSAHLTPAFQIHYWREHLLDFSDCTECGASFANPMPTDEVISRGNDALVKLYQHGRSGDQEFREGRQAYLRGKMLARRLSRWKRKGRLLELGCFHGFFSLGFKENSDWEVAGLEISSELATFVESKLGLKCYLGTLEQAKLPDNHFDFIVCHDLIEHINQPREFLEKLAQILAPGGRIQIITPNGKQDLAYTRRAHLAGMPTSMLLNHIMYFRTPTLRHALQSVGLVPHKIYCYDVRYAAKDFGWFGKGKPAPSETPPSIEESLRLKTESPLTYWTQERIRELKAHKKTGLTYGLLKESLPKALTIKVPARLEIGHEIYALAEKPLRSSR